MMRRLELPSLPNLDFQNLESCFDRFAKVIQDRLQQLDSQALPSAVNVISHFLNVDPAAKQRFLAEVQQCQKQQEEESIYDQLFKKMAELDASSAQIQPAGTFNATEADFAFQSAPVAVKLSFSPVSSFPAQLKIPSIDLQLHPAIVQENATAREPASSYSAESSINAASEPSVHKSKTTSAAEKNQFFREAVVHVFNVKEEMTDEQLCHVVQESKICMWKQISEYSNGMMTTKQVSDYFWKTFVRACYKDQLTQQDKNYLTQIAHQNPRSSAAYLYDVVKPRFEGRNVFHDNVKMFLNCILSQLKKMRAQHHRQHNSK
ncbi:Hypothetical_protein [Hexamita inflata]|uniref:Hypothetical_protein n=1 Tax=Hexamita inflata TaxID=28002 RepID=A0AA86Q3X3_9EUKA|nr:Hypothetical protein HINF_LOCUS32784 [Hexamita inflata]